MTVPATPKKEAATVALTAASTLATIWVTEMLKRSLPVGAGGPGGTAGPGGPGGWTRVEASWSVD